MSSADGRYVAYDGDSRVQYLDRETGRVTTIPAPYSTVESISADGEVVSLRSQDNTVVPGTPFCASRTVDCYKIYVWHRSTGAVTLVTNGGFGLSASSQLSADGTRITFYSEAHGLVPGDTTTQGQVYLADLTTGTITQVTAGDGYSDRPDLSADGRWVSFSSSATDLVPGETSSDLAGYLYDRTTGRTTRITPVGLTVADTQVSGDGSTVAYTASDPAGATAVFVLDRRSGTGSRLNPSATLANGLTLSQDGRWVVTSVTDDVRDADNHYPPPRLLAYDTARGGAATTITTVTSRTGTVYPLEWVGSRLLPFTADESDAGPAGSYLWSPPASS